MGRVDRADISDYLVHFIRADDDDAAFDTLLSIAIDGGLRGGTGYIRGDYECVCFSEAPLDALAAMLRRPRVEDAVPYRPFGVIVAKTWLYDQGGRPVIYQSDPEFYELPESLRWRHVRYEPTGNHTVDFTWEREWRVHTTFLDVDPGFSLLVVPNEDWAQDLARQYEAAQEEDARRCEEAMDFPWQFFVDRIPWRFYLLYGRE